MVLADAERECVVVKERSSVGKQGANGQALVGGDWWRC